MHIFGVASTINCGFQRKTLFWLLKYKIFILDVIVVTSMATLLTTITVSEQLHLAETEITTKVVS